MAQKINCLIIGSGGREHALGWKLKQSPRCGRLFFAPGNGGTGQLGQNVDLAVEPVNTKHADAIDYFCRTNDVAMVIIGPEDPLAGGLADRLQRDGRWVFGPCAAAAKLEADKAYAKHLMRAANIPTADARSFTDYEQARAYIEQRETPVVVKAAGLAKGKGAIVTSNTDEALDALRRCMVDLEFGEAGQTVVVEERLVGQELSVLALVDGRNLYVLDPAQDHKQIYEADRGPNTGGMGAYCPTPLVNDTLMSQVERDILVPTVDALRREGVDFRGVLYAGLMLTAGGPKVIEFNCRFGDPECQPLMMRMKGDLLDVLIKCCEGRLDEANIDWDPRNCCCVVMASGGYPGKYETGKPITGIAEAEADQGVKVFHAGTKRGKDGALLTSGGRVLNVCALGKDLKEAQQKANAACDRIAFEGAYFRRDIGHRVM
ncbi:MAG: phosphoribosylamine--glycine ligase [Phycisphaeraceae bacterium]|nr:phosphoribosylamine--glycine ligase [Phycisphaeraceae bacterium]